MGEYPATVAAPVVRHLKSRAFARNSAWLIPGMGRAPRSHATLLAAGRVATVRAWITTCRNASCGSCVRGSVRDVTGRQRDVAMRSAVGQRGGLAAPVAEEHEGRVLDGARERRSA